MTENWIPAVFSSNETFKPHTKSLILKVLNEYNFIVPVSYLIILLQQTNLFIHEKFITV